MSAWQWIQKKLLGRSDIVVNGDVYMRRWLIGPRAFGIRLHNIIRSDSDRELHDHPFTFFSIVLCGGYHEETSSGLIEWYGPGSIIFRRAEELHRLDLEPKRAQIVKGRIIRREKSAWTLVFRGPYRRTWGFMTEKGWIPWQEFCDEKNFVTNPQPASVYAAKSST